MKPRNSAFSARLERLRTRAATAVVPYRHWWHYRRFDPRHVPQPTPRAAAWLGPLRRDGILRLDLPELHAAAADYVQSDAAGSAFARDARSDEVAQFGVRHCAELSFRMPSLRSWFLHADLASLAHAYLRRPAGFRNLPVDQDLEFVPGIDSERGHGNLFHNDALGQLSWMLLLTETNENDPHLVYAVGTHRRALGWRGMHLDPASAARLAAGSARIAATGSPGTLYVFDAFGVHRRVLRAGRRRMIHCNLNTGHYVRPFWDRVGDWEGLRTQPEGVRLLFRWAQ